MYGKVSTVSNHHCNFGKGENDNKLFRINVSSEWHGAPLLAYI